MNAGLSSLYVLQSIVPRNSRALSHMGLSLGGDPAKLIPPQHSQRLVSPLMLDSGADSSSSLHSPLVCTICEGMMVVMVVMVANPHPCPMEHLKA